MLCFGIYSVSNGVFVTLVKKLQSTFPTSKLNLYKEKQKSNTKSIMVHIKLFIKNTLTNLFPTFYRGSHPINRQVLYAEKWQHQNSTCPVDTYPKSPVQNEHEGKGEGWRRLQSGFLLVFVVLFKAFRDSPAKQNSSLSSNGVRCAAPVAVPVPDLPPCLPGRADAGVPVVLVTLLRLLHKLPSGLLASRQVPPRPE